MIQSSREYEQINIGTNENPKFVNLGKCCSEVERNKFIDFLVEFRDVFVWSYDDLSTLR